MKLTIIGCGDAFGSGGRLQSAYLLDEGADRLLIDCGASTQIGLVRQNIDANSITRIVISHLHGDHYAGLIWFIMAGMFVSRRTQSLQIFGPPGIEARVLATMDLLFPGVATLKRAFTVQYTEMTPQAATEIGGWVVHVYDVDHPSGAPSHALRLEGYGKVFAFTGDSQWCEAVVTAGRNADLYLMECYRFAGQPFMHLSWENILGSLDRIGARRVLLTHMSADMLAQQGAIHDPRITFADDGLVVTI